MQLGFIGLGKMGSRMAEKLLKEGHNLVLWNRSEQGISNFQFQISNTKQKPDYKIAKTVEILVQSLGKPRVIWSMLPAGSATQNMIDEIEKYVEKDDIVIDGSNSNYKDTEKRYKFFKKQGVRFLGIGISGGIIAAKTGYPIMAGGDKSAYEKIKPILDSLAKPDGGHQYFGEGGVGAFVKMIHNGIEYGIMQSLAEGYAVLKKAPYDFDLVEVTKLWQKGTLVSGFMLDRSLEVLENNPELQGISGAIATSGEGDWTVEQAKEENIAVPIIKASLAYRKETQKDPKLADGYTAKFVNALRQAFGGHPVKKD